MKQTKYSSLGLDINLSVPATVEEFDQNAKKEGACLIEAVNNVVYRGSLAEFRDVFLHGCDEEKDETGKVLRPAIKGIDAITGIPRREIPVMKDGKPVLRDGVAATVYDPEDSEGKYFKRVLAQLGKEAKDFQAHADAVAKVIVFDASATERKPTGPKKLAEKYKKVAIEFLQGRKSLDKLNAAFKKSINKTFTATTKDADGKAVAVDAAVNVEALGWLCKEYEAAQDVFSKVG